METFVVHSRPNPVTWTAGGRTPKGNREELFPSVSFVSFLVKPVSSPDSQKNLLLISNNLRKFGSGILGLPPLVFPLR